MQGLYADYSGTAKDNATRVIAYAIVFLDDNLNNRLIARRNSIIEELHSISPAFDSEIEFHTIDIYQGKGPWRALQQRQRDSTIRKLRAALLELHIPYAFILIDKGQGGVKSAKTARNRFRSVLEPKYSIDDREFLEDLRNENPDLEINTLKGDQFLTIISILFGLGIGLVNYRKPIKETQIIADDQFVKQTDLWDHVFRLFKSKYWNAMKIAGLFENWRTISDPVFCLGEKIVQDDSAKHLGIQLADYIAYTSRFLLVPEKERDDRLAPTRRVKHMEDTEPVNMPGVYIGVGP